MKDATVLFDLDGTVVDSAPDLIAATNHTLRCHGWEPVAPEIVRPAVSLGANSMILAGLSVHRHDPETDELDRMRGVFLDYYTEHLVVETRAFPGFVESAAVLRAAGVRLAICTNKREDLARGLLGALELTALFEVIAGRDTFPVCKPDAGHLLGALAMLGGDPARTVMVGDSTPDAEAARAARLPFIAVSFGYDADPAGLGPDVLINHYSELVPAVEQLIRRRNA